MLNKIFLGVFSLALVSMSLSVPSANADNWHDKQWKARHGYGRNSHNYKQSYNQQCTPNASAYKPAYTPAYTPVTPVSSVSYNTQGSVSPTVYSALSSGRISQSEANRLLSKQAEIDALHNRYVTDYSISYPERERINQRSLQMQDQLWRDMNSRNRLY